MSRPWMPLYVADYLADTLHLSNAENGAYLLLIMHYWQKGSLPDDDRKLASIARASPEQWSDMRATIAEFFGPGWKHARIDEELAEAEEKYRKRAEAGRSGGKAKAAAKQSASNAGSNAQAGLNQPQPPSQASTKQEGADAPSSSEPENSAPSVATLPTVSEGEIPFFESDIAEWSAAFPAVNVRQQLAAMRSWLIANPTKRKTKRGMRKFVVAWLDRKQNAGAAPVARSGSPPRKPNAFDAYEQIAQERGWHEQEILPGNNGDVECLPAEPGGHSGPVIDLRAGSEWH